MDYSRRCGYSGQKVASRSVAVGWVVAGEYYPCPGGHGASINLNGRLSEHSHLTKKMARTPYQRTREQAEGVARRVADSPYGGQHEIRESAEIPGHFVLA